VRGSGQLSHAYQAFSFLSLTLSLSLSLSTFLSLSHSHSRSLSRALPLARALWLPLSRSYFALFLALSLAFMQALSKEAFAIEV